MSSGIDCCSARSTIGGSPSSPAAGVAACVAAGLIDVLPERRVRFRHVAVQRVVALDVPPGRRAEIHHAIAQLLLDRGLGPAAVVAHHSVAASEVDPAAAVSAARRAALEASAAGAHRDAADWFARAGAAARSLGDPGTSDRIRCSIGEGDELRLAGDPRQGVVLAEAFKAACATGDDALVAEAADDPVARFEARHLGFSVAIQRADAIALRAHLDDMVASVDQVGDVGRRWQLLYQLAAVAHLDDDLERSERLNTDAMNLFAPVSATRALAAYGGQLLAIRMAQGRVSELADTFELMVADQPEVPGWHAALSLALVEVDHGRAASHAVRALSDVPHDFLWLAAHLIGGRTAAMVGERETAAAYLERLAPWSGRVCWQGTCSYGPVDTTLALLHRSLGDTGATDHHARRATEVAERLGAPVFLRDLDELGLPAVG